MLKKLMITTAVSGLLIGGALAEGTPPSSDTTRPAPQAQPADKTDKAMPADKSASAPASQSTAQFINSQRQDQYLASNFKGTDVIGADNEKIGDVNDILFDKNGKVEAYVISVGGFLGMGAKDVALAPSSFEVVAGDKSKNEADKLKLSMSKDQLKQAASFEPYKAPRTTTGTGTPNSRPTSPAPSSR